MDLKSTVSLGDAYDRFLEEYVAAGAASDILQKHRKMKKGMVEFLGDVLVRSITVDDIAKFRESWKLAPQTTRNQIEKIRQFFKFCIKREWAERNPAALIKLPKIVELERKPYEKDEIERINQAIDEFTSSSMWVLWGLGDLLLNTEFLLQE
jgi:site-specific recombinase XerD